MIETEDIKKEVSERVDEIVKDSPTVDKLVGQLKKLIMTAVSKKGITVDDSIEVAAKMIVLASLVK
mgnify:CR=1 FL=1